MRPESRPSPALLFSILVIALAAGLLHGCHKESPTAPGGHGEVQSVSVTVGVPGMGSLTTGGTITINAWATLANGESQNCTATATWKSSNPSVAAVTTPGTLSGFGAGTAQISATCSGVTGVATVTVFMGATLSGTVRDENGSPLAGAMVSVMVSKYGRGATSDATGRYVVTGIVLGGSYTVYVRKDGYEMVSETVPIEAADVTRDFTLRVGIQVSGRITEAGVGPLEGAIVEVVSGVNAGKKSLPTTSWSGGYSIAHLLPGRFTLRASKPGYDAVERELDLAVSTSGVDFTLKASYGSCLVGVTPLLIERFPSAGGEATITVDAPASGSWTSGSDQPWVELLTGSNTTGPGLVRLRIQPAVPGATDNRMATVRVGCSATEGQNVKVSQLPDCKTSLAWAPDSPTTFGAAGGTGHVIVRTGTPGCHWQAVSRSEWIHTVGINDWYGDREAHFVVQPNTTGAARVGSLVIGEAVWQVTQAGQ